MKIIDRIKSIKKININIKGKRKRQGKKQGNKKLFKKKFTLPKLEFMKGKSIAKKLLIVFLLFSIIPIMIVGFFSYTISATLIRDKVSDVTEQLIVQVVNNYERNLNDLERLSLSIITSNEFKSNLSQLKDEDTYESLMNRKKVEDFLNHQMIANEKIQSILVVHDNKIIGNQSKSIFKLEDENATQIMQAITELNGVSHWFSLPTEDETEQVILLGRKIPEVNSLLIVEMNQQEFIQELASIQLGQSGAFSMINQHEEMIFTTAEENHTDPSIFKEVLEVEANDENAITFESRNQQLVTTKQIKNTDWLLFSNVPMKELTTETTKISTITLIIGIITALISMSVAIFITYRMSKPIKKASDLMSEVAVGDLTVGETIQAMNPKKLDEIGQLTQSLKNMADSIRSTMMKTSETALSVSSSAHRLSENAVYNRDLANETNHEIEQVAQLSQETVASTEECAVAFEAIAIDIQKIAEVTSTVSTNASSMVEEAEMGQTFISSAMDEMNHVNQTVSESVELISDLNDRSSQIAKITDMIRSIAEQTNLLSLNASIEAARAGEHGRGFTVVANEVRKLAQQSQEATKQIGELITSIQTSTQSAMVKVSQGKDEVMKSNEVIGEAGTRFTTIVQAIQQISTQIKDVSMIVHEISANSEELSATVHVMNENTTNSHMKSVEIQQSIAKQLQSIDQSSTDSQQLEELAQQLLQEIKSFKVEK